MNDKTEFSLEDYRAAMANALGTAQVMLIEAQIRIAQLQEQVSKLDDVSTRVAQLQKQVEDQAAAKPQGENA